MIEPTPTDNPPAALEAAAPPSPTARSYSAVALLLFGVGGLLACWGLAAVVGVLAALDVSSRGLGALAVITFLGIGALGLPLVWQAMQRLRGQPALAWRARRGWMIGGPLIALLALAAGQAALSFDVFPGFVVGLAQWLVVVAEATTLAAFTFGAWNGLTRLRAWGYALSGAWLGTGLSFILEIAGGVGFLVIGAFLLTLLAPTAMRDLQHTLRSFQFTQDLSVFTPWLSNPWVVMVILLAVAVFIPLLEEVLKALGIAFTVRRGLTPAVGFYGGVLSGLGFAVVESLLNLSTPQPSWLLVMVARTGTMVVHAFCTGLVGWGWGHLAVTRRPWKLLLGYGSAVLVHGLWNASAIGMSLAGIGLMPQLTFTHFNPQQLGLVLVIALCLIVLGGLALGALAGLGLMGYRLRQTPKV